MFIGRLVKDTFIINALTGLFPGPYFR